MDEERLVKDELQVAAVLIDLTTITDHTKLNMHDCEIAQE